MLGTAKKGRSRIQVGEMKFLRNVKVSTRQDRIPNKQIRADLDVYRINDKTDDYESRWKQHIDRVSPHRLSKIIKSYKPRRKQDVGRPRKRWSLRRRNRQSG